MEARARTALVAAVALVAGAAAGWTLRPLAEPRADDAPPLGASASAAPRARPVYGAALVDGVANGPLPVLPLRADAEGRLVGLAAAPVHEAERDVLAWFRTCGAESSPGLAPDWEGDDALRWFDPSPGREPPAWYAARVGEPVRVADFPPGRTAYAAWRSEGLEGANVTVVLLARLNDTAFPPLARAFTHEGIVAVSARSTHRCATVAFVADLPPRSGGRPRAAAPFGDDPHLVVDVAHSGAWDPREIVRTWAVEPGVLETHPSAFAPLGDEGACLAAYWHGLGNGTLAAPPGGRVATTHRLVTEEVAFRNLTWRAYLAPESVPAWSRRAADFDLGGPREVAPNATVLLPVAFDVPDGMGGAWSLGVSWEGELSRCGGAWVPFAHGSVGSDANARLDVG